MYSFFSHHRATPGQVATAPDLGRTFVPPGPRPRREGAVMTLELISSPSPTRHPVEEHGIGSGSAEERSAPAGWPPRRSPPACGWLEVELGPLTQRGWSPRRVRPGQAPGAQDPPRPRSGLRPLQLGPRQPTRCRSQPTWPARPPPRGHGSHHNCGGAPVHRGAAAHIQMHHRHDLGTLCRVEDDPLSADAAQSRFTTRLRLEPVGPANARDLWLVHNDDEVAYWYNNERPSLEEAEQRAKFMGDSWRFHGVHKWIAYRPGQR